MMKLSFFKVTNFEKFILVVGLTIFVAGFFMINKVFKAAPVLSYPLITVSFLWLILIFMTILTDSNESIKEEIKEILDSQVKEIRLMQQISKEELAELKILRGKNAGKK